MVCSVSRTKIPSLSSSDPVRVAWRSLSPAETSEQFSISETNGVCARCEIIALVVPLHKVVSENFTGWGTVDPNGEGFCESCAWAFQEPALRVNSILIHQELGAVWASREQVATCLQVPFTEEITLSIPLQGKKHLLPYAEWGTVVSDDGAYPWGENEAKLATLLIYLRGFGVKESEFNEPVPPYRIVSELLSDTTATLELMEKWELLRSWHGTPQLLIAVRGTRPEKLDRGGEIDASY